MTPTAADYDRWLDWLAESDRLKDKVRQEVEPLGRDARNTEMYQLWCHLSTDNRAAIAMVKTMRWRAKNGETVSA